VFSAYGMTALKRIAGRKRLSLLIQERLDALMKNTSSLLKEEVIMYQAAVSNATDIVHCTP
jgi:hypothetical protein